MVVVDAAGAEDHVRLLRRLGQKARRRRFDERLSGDELRRPAFGPPLKRRLQRLNRGGVVDVARDRHHQGPAKVVLPEMAADVADTDGTNALFGTGDVDAEGVVGPELLLKQCVDVVAGGVEVHAELLQDHVALLLHLFGLQ